MHYFVAAPSSYILNDLHPHLDYQYNNLNIMKPLFSLGGVYIANPSFQLCLEVTHRLYDKNEDEKIENQTSQCTCSMLYVAKHTHTFKSGYLNKRIMYRPQTPTYKNT